MKKYLILFDVHCPAHNKTLFEKIFELCIKEKFFGLVIGGDFLDLFSLGSYNADSLKLLKDWTLTEEYEQGEKLLRNILSAMGSNCSEKHYIFGNHEDRYFRELKKGDRAKYGSGLMSPIQGLNLIEKGFRVEEDWMDGHIMLGKLKVWHGYYTNLHTAHKVVNLAQENSMFGHTHRENSCIIGKFGAWNIGTLAEIQNKLFSYMPPLHRKLWTNSFAIVNVIDEEGHFFVENVHCVENKFVYSGKIY